jgi:hypothetical protein
MIGDCQTKNYAFHSCIIITCKFAPTSFCRNVELRKTRQKILESRKIYSFGVIAIETMELDNANPTIVNPSELPSYRERRKIKDESQQKHGIRQLLMGKSSYAIDPFYLSDYSDTDSDDSGVEPIDEQEIYGE